MVELIEHDVANQSYVMPSGCDIEYQSRVVVELCDIFGSRDVFFFQPNIQSSVLLQHSVVCAVLGFYSSALIKSMASDNISSRVVPLDS